MVVLLPALFVLMFAGIQAGIWYQARAVVLAAAQEGARAAAAENGSSGAGVQAARGYIDSTTIGLNGTSISGARDATEATVTITTHTLSLVPAWSPQITQSASQPVERITG